jgi:hypothetical protein
MADARSGASQTGTRQYGLRFLKRQRPSFVHLQPAPVDRQFEPDVVFDRSALQVDDDREGLFFVGSQLGRDPVLVGDLDDVGRINVFPLDSRRAHF